MAHFIPPITARTISQDWSPAWARGFTGRALPTRRNLVKVWNINPWSFPREVRSKLDPGPPLGAGGPWRTTGGQPGGIQHLMEWRLDVTPSRELLRVGKTARRLKKLARLCGRTRTTGKMSSPGNWRDLLAQGIGGRRTPEGSGEGGDGTC